MGIPGSLAVWLACAAPAAGQAVEAPVSLSPALAAPLAAAALLLPQPAVTPRKADALLWGGASLAKRVEYAPSGRVRLAYLRADQPIAFDGEALRRYRSALAAADDSPSAGDAGKIVTAAAELARSGGIEVDPVETTFRGQVQPGLRVAPSPEGSRLNRMAHRLLTRLGASLDYVPGRTGSATGAFNAAEARLMAPGFLHEESYPGLLHEIRHAFFSALLQRGEVRLFHLSAISRTGAPLSPRAEGYSAYLSFEELSTFPKTLRHLVSLVRAAPDEQSLALRRSLLRARARQYASLLTTAEYLMGRVRARSAAGELRAVALDSQDPMVQALEAPVGGTLYRVSLGHADLYLPVERRAPAYEWYRRLFGRADTLALEVLRLKAELTSALVADASPELAALWEDLSAESPDWTAVQRRADRLVGVASRRDREFRDRNPAK